MSFLPVLLTTRRACLPYVFPKSDQIARRLSAYHAPTAGIPTDWSDGYFSAPAGATTYMLSAPYSRPASIPVTTGALGLPLIGAKRVSVIPEAGLVRRGDQPITSCLLGSIHCQSGMLADTTGSNRPPLRVLFFRDKGPNPTIQESG